MKFLFPVIVCLLLAGPAAAQPDYPRHYFRNPLDIPVRLAGNFGECRPNHFHTGLDLKTNERENLRVYAAADGYVSRISISHSGYGNALYIVHPNGYTTVYGHLNDFYPALQQYMLQQQYAMEQWAIDLTLPAGKFPVKKGQFIAFSGTTGGSTGPHLHFEIRDSKTEHVLNGALFGLPITDGLPPVPKSMALYRPGSIYEQQPVLLPLKKTGAGYQPPGEVAFDAPELRVAVLADDYMNGSPNTLGVYAMKLYLDNELQASWALDEIDFDENRYVNAFADYRLKEDKKGWYQTLFRTGGNRLRNYTYLNSRNGSLDISDGLPHQVHIELSDAEGNQSDVRFTVTYSGGGHEAPAACTMWKAGKSNTLLTEHISFAPDAAALYDDICFRHSDQKIAGSKYYSNSIQLHDTRIPLQTGSKLGLRLTRIIPFGLRSKLVFVHHIKAAALPGNNPQDAAAAQYDNGWAYATVKTFGNYYVSIDTIAPTIKPLQKGTNFSKARHLRFSVTDNLTSVQQFRAELDGKWLRFVRSGNTYTYTFDERCSRGRHTLVITAADENNNTRKFSLDFTR